ncbi:oxidoreductase [Adlercreutzia sp. ZJ304]|uniref:oxidoreductase n=1 Tax=Adlercreutzia sp. ZJ304 TaxID=2709791 RepID=UPI0013EDF473|nr:oxidoreductase [Adlercreutzia sp. ZJ304]
MSYKGLLIDVDYCYGCQACVLACQQEHAYEDNQYGIYIHKLGPIEINPGKWQYDFLPQLTDWCDLCEDRVSGGKHPSCVQHCQAQCLEYGDVEELAKKVFRQKQVIVAQREN